MSPRATGPPDRPEAAPAAETTRPEAAPAAETTRPEADPVEAERTDVAADPENTGAASAAPSRTEVIVADALEDAAETLALAAREARPERRAE